MNDTLFSQMPTIEAMRKQLVLRARGDKFIWGIVVLLALISVLVVYSATNSLAYKMHKGNNEVYLFKQLAFMLVGLVIIYFMHRVNYTIYSRLAWVFFLSAIPLLIYTLLFTKSLNEANRWVKIPIINMTVQTSDYARLALFMYISRVLSKKQEVIKEYKKGFLPVIGPVAIVCALIAPANLSTALLTGATSLLLMFIGRISLKHIFLAILVAAIPVGLLVSIAVLTHKKANDTTTETTRIEAGTSKLEKLGRVGTWVGRIQSYIYPDNKKDHYQMDQSKIAIANGGILVGLGPGNSRQRNFLPHCYSDFIFAIIIEEYGLFGGAFIMVVYLVFLFRGIKIFRRCPYAFGAFLALGLSFTLVIQALANMAVSVNIVPVTGVTLPLVSMGGSSFLFTCMSIGIILSVARNVEIMEGKMEPESVLDIPRANVPTAVATGGVEIGTEGGNKLKTAIGATPAV